MLRKIELHSLQEIQASTQAETRATSPNFVEIIRGTLKSTSQLGKKKDTCV